MELLHVALQDLILCFWDQFCFCLWIIIFKYCHWLYFSWCRCCEHYNILFQTCVLILKVVKVWGFKKSDWRKFQVQCNVKKNWIQAESKVQDFIFWDMFCRMMKIQCKCQEYILMCKVQIGSEILKKVICAFKMITSVHQRKVLW